MLTYEEAIEKVTARISENRVIWCYTSIWGVCFALVIAYGVDENTVSANVSQKLKEAIEIEKL